MKEKFKNFARAATPPFILYVLKGVFRPKHFEYDGNFSNWPSALEQSEGYDNPAIFEKVKNARLAVLRGEKAYERDSVLFDETQYFWPLLSALLYAAAKNGGRLSVLDFGGSLGSSYFQNLPFLKALPELSWSIVEQKQFVDFGRTALQSAHLKFYESIGECLASEKPNVVLLSSALQYVEKPYELLAELKKKKIRSIIFDRTIFLEHLPDRLTVQHPPKKIYTATFPAWFFGLQKFKKFFEPEYRPIAEWPSIGDPIPLKDTVGRNKGLLFELNERT